MLLMIQQCPLVVTPCAEKRNKRRRRWVGCVELLVLYAARALYHTGQVRGLRCPPRPSAYSSSSGRR